MSQPYVGEIRMFGGNFAPAGWAFCNGQLVAISENDTLFQLIGTTYGGDGQSTFALPDLRGRLPIHAGTGPGLSTYTLGQLAGSETVTLTPTQIPFHSHNALASSDPASINAPSAGVILAAASAGQMFSGSAPTVAMGNGNSVSPAGGSQPHNNIMPFLCVSFIISLFGIFPSPS